MEPKSPERERQKPDQKLEIRVARKLEKRAYSELVKDMEESGRREGYFFVDVGVNFKKRLLIVPSSYFSLDSAYMVSVDGLTMIGVSDSKSEGNNSPRVEEVARKIISELRDMNRNRQNGKTADTVMATLLNNPKVKFHAAGIGSAKIGWRDLDGLSREVKVWERKIDFGKSQEKEDFLKEFNAARRTWQTREAENVQDARTHAQGVRDFVDQVKTDLSSPKK